MKKRPVVVVTRRLAERDRDPHAGAVRRPPQPRRHADVRRGPRRRGARRRRARADRDGRDRRGTPCRSRAVPQAHRQFRQRRRQYRRARSGVARNHRDQHAGRPHRRHGRHDHGADHGGGAPPAGGRPPHPGRCLEWLVSDLDARPPDHRQAARHRRHGPDRPGARPPGEGFRPFDPLPQPAPRPGPRRGGTRGDLLGIARPDAGADGHRVGELPAHARDLSPFIGAPPQADEARCASS